MTEILMSRLSDLDNKTIVEGTPLDKQIALWTSSNTIKGNPNFVFDGTNLGVGVGTPLGRLHVDQANAVGAKPVIYLDQGDTSEEFIRFISVEGASENNPISTLTTEVDAPAGYIRINVNGTIRWLRFYADTD